MSDAIERAEQIRRIYSDSRWTDEDPETAAIDIVADQLLALPEWQRNRVIRMALLHAETEGSTNPIERKSA